MFFLWLTDVHSAVHICARSNYFLNSDVVPVYFAAFRCKKSVHRYN